RIDQLRSSAEAPQGQAAPVRPAAPVVAEPATPAGAATPEPSPTPKIAKPRQPSPARGLEENLTSRWFVWLGAIAVALAGTFLVKYSIDEGYLGPAARCVLGFLLGAVLAVGRMASPPPFATGHRGGAPRLRSSGTDGVWSLHRLHQPLCRLCALSPDGPAGRAAGACDRGAACGRTVPAGRHVRRPARRARRIPYPGADRHAQPQCMGTLRLSDSDRGRGARRGALQGMVVAGTRRTRGKRGMAAALDERRVACRR